MATKAREKLQLRGIGGKRKVRSSWCSVVEKVVAGGRWCEWWLVVGDELNGLGCAGLDEETNNQTAAQGLAGNLGIAELCRSVDECVTSDGWLSMVRRAQTALARVP